MAYIKSYLLTGVGIAIVAASGCMGHKQKPGEPGDMRATHRGAHSLTLSTQVLLVVDETVMQDIAYLKQIPASDIESIRVMSAREGTVWYGTQAGNGVIVVITDVFGDSTTDG